MQWSSYLLSGGSSKFATIAGLGWYHHFQASPVVLCNFFVHPLSKMVIINPWRRHGQLQFTAYSYAALCAEQLNGVFWQFLSQRRKIRQLMSAGTFLL